MVGWFVLVWWMVGALLGRGVPGAWPALVASLLAWFVPDTAFSLLSGFWPNAVLNTVVLAAFLPGIVATAPRSRPGRRLQPQQPPPQQPPPAAGEADARTGAAAEPPVTATADQTRTMSACPDGHDVGTSDALTERRISKTSPHSRHR